MIDMETIAEIVATYLKHGWILRRVLLSAELKKKLGVAGKSLFGDVPTVDSDIDAAWFSRPPKTGGIAWEIRYMGDVPLALLEKLDEDDPAFESAIKNVERRLAESVAKKEAA